MKALTAHGSCIAVTAISNSKLGPHRPANSGPYRVSFEPISSASTKPSTFRYPRLRILQSKALVPQRRRPTLLVAVAAAAADDESGTHSEAEPGISSDVGATIDIKLPRRSLIVQFTCNDCGERTERLISRLAYERGLVFVQCAGCQKYHKLADNLGLIVEYDLRDEISTDPTAD